MPQRIGIVGVPPLAVICKLEDSSAAIIDLDEARPGRGSNQNLLPRVYCAVLRTVAINATSMDLDKIFIDVGPGKCDCALHLAAILDDLLDIAIIRTRNIDNRAYGFPLCRARMGLKEKMIAITRSVQTTAPGAKMNPCRASTGFWGVPPRDFSILDLFPDTTHVYGWSRCMENKTPADLELESHCNPEVPTVFFAQSFCAKTALARHLAERHPRGLYVDCDVSAGSSIRTKIGAFLELSGVFDSQETR